MTRTITISVLTDPSARELGKPYSAITRAFRIIGNGFALLALMGTLFFLMVELGL
jgi:hypothetical protein